MFIKPCLSGINRSGNFIRRFMAKVDLFVVVGFLIQSIREMQAGLFRLFSCIASRFCMNVDYTTSARLRTYRKLGFQKDTSPRQGWQCKVLMLPFTTFFNFYQKEKYL